MVQPFWSRLTRLSVGTALLAALSACSAVGVADDGGSTPEPANSQVLPQDAAGGAVRVSLLQKLGDGPVRTLLVDLDGRWECNDCAGDGVTSTGTLTPDQVTRLRGLIADPGLARETDQARDYRQACIDALTSTLLIPPGRTITSQDCPGEERPPIAEEILLLLTQATPAEVKG